MEPATFGKQECPLITHVIRAPDAAACLSVNPNSNVALTGNLDVAGRILIDGSHLYVQPKS